MDKISRVLIVATSRKTRGGITSVIKAHETGEQWNKYHCHWVQTHRDGPSWRKTIYFAIGMVDFLIRLPFYDIVHIHTADYGTEKRKQIFARITKIFGKKLIVHLHSSGPEFSIGGKYRNLYEYSFTHADKVILLSKTWKQEVINAFHLPEDKMEILYNPCPTVEPSKSEERDKYILFAGTLTHRKGYDDLIKAFATIANKFPEWRLKLAGNGEIDNGRRLVKQYNIEKQVDFLGWVNGQEKDTAFRHASIYCLPSYSEGFPMGVLDAWAYHLPVVTTPVGGIPDIAVDGENLMLFNPGDLSSLAAKLEILINDKDKYDIIQSASIHFAKVNFNINTISKKLSSIYSKLSYT